MCKSGTGLILLSSKDRKSNTCKSDIGALTRRGRGCLLANLRYVGIYKFSDLGCFLKLFTLCVLCCVGATRAPERKCSALLLYCCLQLFLMPYKQLSLQKLASRCAHLLDVRFLFAFCSLFATESAFDDVSLLALEQTE